MITAPNVTMSLPVPPMMVSTLDAVKSFPSLLRMILSPKVPRSITLPVKPAVKVRVSTAPEPSTLSTFMTVRVLAPVLAKTSLSVPAPKS